MAHDAELPLALTLRFAPSGALHLDVARHADGAVTLAPALARRVAPALDRGAAALVLHLGAAEPTAALPAPLGWFRDVGHAFVTALCALPDAERDALSVPLAPDALDRFALSVPPMPGAEYATRDALTRLWSSLASALRDALPAHGGSVAAWLRAQSPLWHLVGRVCFHLAENKRGAPDTPFAFLATYAARLSREGRVQHRPLGDALREHAGARDRAALLALLEPVQAAAKASEVVRALVDADAVYQPLAWTAGEAYAFLRELPAIEASGVRVRVPDFWNARRPPRPRVAVKLGSNAPAALGSAALLDFAVELTLEGEALSDDERERILSSTEGLVLVKGRWIEVDRERLAEVLADWKRVESTASREGVSFAEGLRLLAGASIARDDDDEAKDAADARAAWSEVNPGPWLARALAELRADEGAQDATAGLRAELRPYQAVGARWLWTLHKLELGGCLADDMGLGKTVQVLALLVRMQRAKEKGPSLLVLPASLLANWRAEIERFAPALRAFVAHPSVTPVATLASTTAASLEAYDVVLTSYGSLLRLAWLSDVAWNLVVFDEAQALKNPAAKQTRAARSLRARHRIALTGTPVENRLGDLWSLFDVTSPGLLGSAKQFQRYVRSLEKDTADGYAPLRKLVRPWILRRLKSDPRVIADLPDKTELRAFCALTKSQATLYEEAVDHLAEQLRAGLGGIERRGAILAALMRLKQICNHPAQWLGTGSYAPDESGKFARLAELCEPIAARQDKVLVFTQFRELCEPLERFLAGVFGRAGLVLHGQTPVAKRRALVEDFQREDGPPFFVLSLRAGGTGLNLTAASHVIHFDRWWNPAVENQATDRAYRIGQKQNVLVHKFVCRGTVEEKIDALIESKRALSRELLEDGDEAGALTVTEMTDDALLALVKLDLRGALDAG